MRRKKQRHLLILASLVWASAVGVGLGLLWGYENAPGPAARPPSRWPHDSRLRPAANRATLVMLAHPHCPCTRASIGELNRLMAQAEGRVTTYVLFVKPAESVAAWEKTDLLQSAAGIPGVNVFVDEGGDEARRFRASTSGQTFLYDVEGRLQFSGGITGSRGHAGDNAGRDAVIALLNAERAEETETFAFGCSLFDTHSECRGSSDDRSEH